MATISEYLENRYINTALRATNLTAPTTVYLAFFTSDAGLETGSLTNELSGSGYSRKAITFSAPVSGNTSNTNTISYTATADWNSFYAIAIVDAASGGNVLYWKSVSKKTLKSGQTMFINAGDIKVVID